MIQTLKLVNFRSYEDGLFGFEPGVNIIVGANASGKTNLLQAIHTIATSGGFRLSDRDLVRMGCEWSRVEAMTTEGIRVIKLFDSKPKSIELDSVVRKRLSNQSTMPVVVFEPEHMLLLSKEPERRRALLDDMLAFTTLGYRSAILEYRRALAQRNRLLKQEGVTSDSLFVWDVQLSQRAGTIVAARASLIEQLQEPVHRSYRAISTKHDELAMEYSSKLPLSHYSDKMLSYLRENVHIDLQRGFTGVGPHRDDVLVTLNGIDARGTASRGETRSIVLSLKIAELELLHDSTGKKPLLLLDDVFSELDGSRRRNLAEALKDYQTFLTTTDADVAVDHFSTYNIIPMG